MKKVKMSVAASQILLLSVCFSFTETVSGGQNKSAPTVAEDPATIWIQVPLCNTEKIRSLFYTQIDGRIQDLKDDPERIRKYWETIEKEISRKKDFFLHFYSTNGWQLINESQDQPVFLSDLRQELLNKMGHNLNLDQYKFITIPMGHFKLETTSDLRYLAPEYIGSTLSIFARIESEGIAIIKGFSQSFYIQHPEFTGHEEEISDQWMKIQATSSYQEWTYSELLAKLISVFHRRYPHNQ